MIGGSPTGCDVINQLALTVQPSAATTIQISICEGDAYAFGGIEYTESGTYTEIISGGSAFGCDSTTTLLLTVESILINELLVSICEGENYTFGGELISESGIYSDTIIGGGPTGCDIITNLDLQILPPGRLEQSVRICTGQAYTMNGAIYNTSGIYFDTIPAGAANGCDSLLVLELVVEDAVTNSINAVICEGEGYTINGNIYTTTGSYTETIIGGSSAGCDSVIILDLVVNEAIVNNLQITICEGDSYSIGNDVYTSSGTYSTVLSGGAANGCDSIVNLVLQVNSPAFETISASICTGEEFTLNGISYTSAGVFQDTIFGGAANGCDSILLLTLTELPPATNNIFAEICQGDVFAVNGQFYFDEGIYEQLLPAGAANGCDSTIVIDIKVLPTAQSSEALTIWCRRYCSLEWSALLRKWKLRYYLACPSCEWL